MEANDGVRARRPREDRSSGLNREALDRACPTRTPSGGELRAIPRRWQGPPPERRRAQQRATQITASRPRTPCANPVALAMETQCQPATNAALAAAGGGGHARIGVAAGTSAPDPIQRSKQSSLPTSEPRVLDSGGSAGSGSGPRTWHVHPSTEEGDAPRPWTLACEQQRWTWPRAGSPRQHSRAEIRPQVEHADETPASGWTTKSAARVQATRHRRISALRVFPRLCIELSSPWEPIVGSGPAGISTGIVGLSLRKRATPSGPVGRCEVRRAVRPSTRVVRKLPGCTGADRPGGAGRCRPP